jgi:hypothetical protein
MDDLELRLVELHKKNIALLKIYEREYEPQAKRMLRRRLGSLSRQIDVIIDERNKIALMIRRLTDG